MRQKWTQRVIWVLGAAALFAAGRQVSSHSVDFVVYYRAAKSLVAGRTDLYSSTFSFGPPMTYLYPPLFLLLVFPVAWLSPESAYGVWFAALALGTAGAVKGGCALWRPRNAALHAWMILALAGPCVVLALRYGNAHLLALALLVGGVVAWARGKPWAASGAFALGGAMKLFPLLLIPVFLVRREWLMAGRTILLSCVLWALPAVYFGPRQTLSLYRTWGDVLLHDRPAFERQRGIDQSVAGATERWLTHIDYTQYRDRDYPEVNFVELSTGAARAVALAASLVLIGPSLWMFARLRGPVRALARPDSPGREQRIAATAAIFVAAQLLVGPYTPLPYFSELLLFALALPALWSASPSLRRALFTLATISLLLFAVPGAKSQRALQAAGAFTVIALALWGLAMYAGWLVSKAEAGEVEPNADVALNGARS